MEDEVFVGDPSTLHRMKLPKSETGHHISTHGVQRFQSSATVKGVFSLSASPFCDGTWAMSPQPIVWHKWLQRRRLHIRERPSFRQPPEADKVRACRFAAGSHTSSSSDRSYQFDTHTATEDVPSALAVGVCGGALRALPDALFSVEAFPFGLGAGFPFLFPVRWPLFFLAWPRAS